jgi:septal ring factor EnvC (AmiA/AmiB activator)
VTGVRYVSREEAWRRFEEEMGETGLLEALGGNPLPESFELDLAPAARLYTGMQRIAQESQSVPGVGEAVFGGEWVRRLDRLLAAARLANALAGLLVGLSVIFIISHTIRLTVLAKRDLIEILHVVGASGAFVRLPFVVEGILQSAAAGGLALGLLAVAHRIAAPRLPGLLYLSGTQIGLFLGFAALMGAIGSALAVRGTTRGFDIVRGGTLGALLLTAALAAAGPPARALAAPAPAPTTDQEILERSKELEAIRKEIDENRRKIEALSKQEKDHLRSLRAVEKDIVLTERLLRKLEEQEEDIETELTRERLLHGAVTTELGRMQATLAARARAIYMRGASAELEILLSSRSLRDLVVRTRFLALLLDSDRRLIAQTRERRAEVAEAVVLLEERQREVSAVRAEKQSAKAALSRKKKDRELATRKVRDQKASYEEAVRELERASAEISRLIEKLEASRREREAARRRGETVAPELPDAEFAKNRDRLPWPVTGPVVGRFGTEKHPKFGTAVRNNGIDIAARQGTPFRAVAAGRVEYAEWLAGYGHCAILNHGGGYYTFYAHALDLAVSAGQQVPAGHVLGRVGATDSIRGECLHFEVRKGTTPQNPLDWLR